MRSFDRATDDERRTVPTNDATPNAAITRRHPRVAPSTNDACQLTEATTFTVKDEIPAQRLTC